MKSCCVYLQQGKSLQLVQMSYFFISSSHSFFILLSTTLFTDQFISFVQIVEHLLKVLPHVAMKTNKSFIGQHETISFIVHDCHTVTKIRHQQNNGFTVTRFDSKPIISVRSLISLAASIQLFCFTVLVSLYSG